MSTFYQNALKEFIADTLDINTKNILFNTTLYSDIADDDDGEKYDVVNTYKVETKRKVPTIITGINGEYIPVPNITATNNSIELLFDLAVDDMSGLDEENEFQTVDYNDTLTAIDEFRASILANYFPLGTHYLMFGGDDSELVIEKTSGADISPLLYYMELELKNNDIETIFSLSSGKSLKKTATKLVWYVSAGNTIELDYEIDTTTKILIYRTLGESDEWHMIANAESGTVTASSTNTLDTITLGDTTGLEATLHRFVADITAISNATAELLVVDFDFDTYVTTPTIDLKDFASKNTLVNHGDLTNWTYTGENVILWGSDGNAIFLVYPLTTGGKYRAKNGINYHTFILQLEAIVSDDILFGNNVEYYLDGIQVYPVDRGHTLGTDLGSGQKINNNYNEHIVEESSREHSMTFFYKPTKQLTSLFKHIVSSSIAQNTVYELKVQYPFFKVTYNVVVENGGTNPNLNTLSTFSVTFKRKTSFLT